MPIGQGVRFINDHQIKVGTRSNLTASQRADRAKADASGGHFEGDRIESLLPELFEASHGQIGTGLAFRRTIAVHAVGIRLAHGHETLLETIDCRSHSASPFDDCAPPPRPVRRLAIRRSVEGNENPRTARSTYGDLSY